MDPRPLEAILDDRLWPLVQRLVEVRTDLAGLAVAVVRDDEEVCRGFGVRDLGTREPVTPETMFHLASVSKPFVATAVVSLATSDAEPGLDLDAPLTDLVPELTLADGWAGEVTARGLLSHASGLPDVADYGWHDPQLGDDALSEFARSLGHWRLQSEPGTTCSYSNAGFELLGLLLSRAMGTTFEDAVRRQVLAPLGMATSTFLRADVPPELAASPHVAMPLVVPEGVYPYTRRHAPSSTLHSNLVELCRWMQAHLGGADGGPRLDPELVDLMWGPVLPVGEPPWEEEVGLGWMLGHHRGRRVVCHTGADPGFGARLVLLPDEGLGVVVLANSNTVPTGLIAEAALDAVLGEPGEPALASVSATVDPLADEPDDEEFEKAVWGAIELHRTSLVWPVLRRWTDLRPDSSMAWTMTGWAHQVDGRAGEARTLLRRALDLDPDNEDAALILSGLPDGGDHDG